MPDGEVTREMWVSLKEHFGAALDAHCKKDEIQFDNIKEATRLALVAIQARLDLLNEFRATVDAQNKNFATRDLLDTLIGQLRRSNEELRDELRIMQIKQSNLDGRLAAYGIAMFLVITLVNIGLRFLP